MALELGARVPDVLLPDTDGKQVGIDPLSAATVVVFTCNHCPYALAWHERLQQVARDYAARGVRVLQINPNDAARYPHDSLEAMRSRVAAGEFAGPYLQDATQDAARAWGATVTPDVFVADGEYSPGANTGIMHNNCEGMLLRAVEGERGRREQCSRHVDRPGRGAPSEVVGD